MIALAVWIWLVSVFVAVYFGWTNALIGLVAVLLMEISLDVKRIHVGVGDIYRFFEEQAQEDRNAETLNRIEDALAQGQSADHLVTYTWPPQQH